MYIKFCHVCVRNDLKVELSVQSKNRTERIWMHWENMSKSYHLWASHSAWCKETCVRRARLSYIIARWFLIAFRINFVSASEAERKANRHRLATSIVSSSRSFSSSSSPPAKATNLLIRLLKVARNMISLLLLKISKRSSSNVKNSQTAPGITSNFCGQEINCQHPGIKTIFPFITCIDEPER